MDENLLLPIHVVLDKFDTAAVHVFLFLVFWSLTCRLHLTEGEQDAGTARSIQRCSGRRPPAQHP